MVVLDCPLHETLVTPHFSLAHAPISIPPALRRVRYNASRHPGSQGGLREGANCQTYAYAFIRHYGRRISDFRSSALWADTACTQPVSQAEPFDLMLFHRTPRAWGAHVGVYLGAELVLHLAKHIGIPAIWRLTDFAREPRYACYIGAKRPLSSAASPIE